MKITRPRTCNGNYTPLLPPSLPPLSPVGRVRIGIYSSTAGGELQCENQYPPAVEKRMCLTLDILCDV